MSAESDRFITAAFAISTFTALEEQLWIRRGDFAEFLKAEIAGPLKDLEFLLEPLTTKAQLKNASARFLRQQVEERDAAAALDRNEFQAFVREAMQEMARLARHPWPEYMANGIYRAFDAMDLVLGVDYKRDDGMKTDRSGRRSERLYEGAGVGVQTSYITLMLVLAQMGMGQQHIIDLGSGYGRMGLVVGLLYPQIQFTGYEYVPHRVEVATGCARKAGVDNQVKFVTQDLADPQFQIPAADVYYLYDPFTRETYEQVFRQLIEIGRTRVVTVAAKAAAADWFQEALKGERGWNAQSPQMCDSNTLALFKSTL